MGLKARFGKGGTRVIFAKGSGSVSFGFTSERGTVDWKRETPRQVFHLTNGTIIALLYTRWGASVGWALLIMALGGAFLAWRHTKKPFLWAKPLLELLDRPEDTRRFPAKGAVLYGLGVGFSLVVYPHYAALGAIAVLASGDALSTLVGKAWGKRRWPWNKRLSLEGSVAFFVGATLFAQCFVPFPMALVGALIGALIETVPWPLDDNFTIPIGVGMVLALLFY